MATQLSNLFVIDFEVYIAGVKMPSTSITTTSAFNAIPTCTVAMPPDARLFSIGRQDRVPLQVFVSDTLNGPSWETSADGVEKVPNYILLFDGEITDFGYSSFGTYKEFVITAESIPAFLKQVQFKLLQTMEDYALSGLPSGNISSVLVQNHQQATFPTSLFMDGLAPVAKDNKTIEYPTDFLDNVVAFMTNTGSPAPQKTNAVLEFYGAYCDSIKFSDRYARVPYFDDSDPKHNVSWNQGATKPGFPLLKGLQSQTLYQLYQNMGNSGPVQDSIYNLINYIVASLEYELAVISSPAYIKGKMVQLCLKPLLYEALPPSCNILFRSHVSSLTMNENVMEPPTRILYRDVNSPGAKAIMDSNDASAATILNVHFWPYNNDAVGDSNGKNKLSASLIKDPKERSEEFCGPRVFETTAPPWMGYLAGSGETTDINVVCEQLMKHVYYLKKYERRNLAVTTTFNPYVTPGFPGVVYDTILEGYTGVGANLKFMGQVMVVSHTLTKTAVSTQVQMGFTRLLSEEADTPLTSTMEAMSDEVTHQVEPMTEIYDTLLGPDSIPRTVADLSDETGEALQQAQLDPSAAYKFIKRNIMTRKQYKDFMGCDAASADFTGDYFSKRLDTNLVQTLKDVAAFQCGRSVFKTSS